MIDNRNAIDGALSPYGHKTLARCLPRTDRALRFEESLRATMAAHGEVFERLAAADHRPAPTDTCRCNGGDDPC